MSKIKSLILKFEEINKNENQMKPKEVDKQLDETSTGVITLPNRELNEIYNQINDSKEFIKRKGKTNSISKGPVSKKVSFKVVNDKSTTDGKSIQQMINTYINGLADRAMKDMDAVDGILRQELKEMLAESVLSSIEEEEDEDEDRDDSNSSEEAISQTPIKRLLSHEELVNDSVIKRLKMTTNVFIHDLMDFS